MLISSVHPNGSGTYPTGQKQAYYHTHHRWLAHGQGARDCNEGQGCTVKLEHYEQVIREYANYQPVAGIQVGANVTVTANGHGRSNGSVVRIRGVNNNNHGINGGYYVVADATSSKFTLKDMSGEYVNGSQLGWSGQASGGYVWDEVSYGHASCPELFESNGLSCHRNGYTPLDQL